MFKPFHIALVAVLLSLATGRADVVDDFGGGDWRRFEDTPGTVTAETGKLRLVDSPEPPEYVTASKVHRVDLDQTPVFVVKVAAVTDSGTVKLIRRKPADKREVISIDRPGLYAIDVRKAYGWTGPSEVETCLYAIGDQEDITFEFVKYVAALSSAEQRQIAEREASGNAKLQVAPFELVPLFNSCSVYFLSPPREELAFEFRRKVGGGKAEGAAWQKGFPPVYVPGDGMYRGSIVHLDEDTPYELRVTGGGIELVRGEFRTWRSDVPVAETIVLDETNFTGNLKIIRSGTPDGWIRYTAKDGFVLRNDRKNPLLELSKARYVILDGLTLRGGMQYALTIKRCEHVRIINCDIAGWGRIGTQRFDLNGMYYTEDGEAIDWDTAILISRSTGTVVERCYIHDPVNTSNSWYYAHPAGPQALGINKPRSTVLRYNDFVGSDEHRWNDAIEGSGNFDIDGGFNRDADIHGNFMCFANDDAVETDGGQTNVRVFQNWFEGCLCGVSIQGCMSGPSYIFDNLLVNMGDQRNYAGQSIKTSSNQSGPSAVSFIFGNTSFGDSSDLRLLKHLRIVARNNLFAGRRNITGQADSPQSDCDYNLQAYGKSRSEPHGLVAEPGLVDPAAGLYSLRADSPALGRGLALDNFTVGGPGPVDLGAFPRGADRILPVRPLPVSLDRNQLRFTSAETASATAKSVIATVQGRGFRSRYRIARNEAFDWFTVTPEEGVLESGGKQTFTVALRPERMTARALYKGAFLIRLANGSSRPVMVYAETGYQQAVKPVREGVWTQFAEAETPSGGKTYESVADPAASGGLGIRLAGAEGKDSAEYRFSVPQAGKYFVLLRIRSEVPADQEASIFFSIGDGARDRSELRVSKTWTWCMAAQNHGSSLSCLQSFDLAAGDHVVKIAPREAVHIDLVAVTSDPGIFE
jgi:hypothetical protein